MAALINYAEQEVRRQMSNAPRHMSSPYTQLEASQLVPTGLLQCRAVSKMTGLFPSLRRHLPALCPSRPRGARSRSRDRCDTPPPPRETPSPYPRRFRDYRSQRPSRGHSAGRRGDTDAVAPTPVRHAPSRDLEPRLQTPCPRPRRSTLFKARCHNRSSRS